MMHHQNVVSSLEDAQETVQFCIENGRKNIYFKIISSLTEGHSSESQQEDLLKLKDMALRMKALQDNIEHVKEFPETLFSYQ